jgi:hypothetical protein
LSGTELDVLGALLSGTELEVLGAELSGTELEVLGAVLSGTELEVLGAVLSGAEFDVLGAVLLGGVLDELESATDDVLAAVEATPPDVDATDTDELDPTVFGTDDVGGAESNWAAANPPSPRANPIEPAATIAMWRGSRLRGVSGCGLAMWFLRGSGRRRDRRVVR